MKKNYLIPTIKEKAIDTDNDMLAASGSPNFVGDSDTPKTGKSDKPAPGTSGEAKQYSIWDDSED